MQGIAVSGGGGLADGIAYLRRTQRREGGWGLNETGVTNSQSTSWAVQGLVAAGVDPGQVTRRGRSGLDYLADRQRSDGSYAYNPASAQTPVWVTSQALLALSREAMPVEPIPRGQGASPAPDVAPGAEPPAGTAPLGAGAERGDGKQRNGAASRSKNGDDRGQGGDRTSAQAAE